MSSDKLFSKLSLLWVHAVCLSLSGASSARCGSSLLAASCTS